MKVFLSHATPNKTHVKHVADYLERKGYECWLDAWEMTPGDSLIDKISSGIESSDKLVIFLSPESIESNWVKKEVNSGLILEIAEEKGLGSKFVIPVLFENCKVPILLREKIYANFTDKKFEDACDQLISGLLDVPTKERLEPMTNAVIRKFDKGVQANKLHLTKFEFTTSLSPIYGATVFIETDGYRADLVSVHMGPSNDVSVSGVISSSFSNVREKKDGVVYFRQFGGPDIRKGESLYVELYSDQPLVVRNIVFKDGYGRDI